MTPSVPESLRLDRVLSQLPQHMCEVQLGANDAGRFTLRYAGPGLFAMFGLEPAAVPSTHLLSQLQRLVHPGDWERICTLLRDAGRHSSACAGQCRIILPGGLERRVDFRAEPAPEPGQGTSWRIVLTDFTALRDVEQFVHGQHERLELATQVGGVGIWEAEMPEGRYLFNEQMHEIYGIGDTGFRAGVPPNTFGGDGMGEWLAVLHPDDIPVVLAAFERGAQTLEIFEYEHRIFRPSGEMRHVRSAARVIANEQGIPYRAVGTAMDVTDQKRLTEALTKEKERLVLAARAGHIGIWDINFRDEVFIWDEQMHAIYGLAPGAFSGKLADWIPLLHPDDVGAVLEQWQRAVDDTSTFDTSFRAVHASGRIIHIRALAQVIAEPDGTRRALGINLDVTTERSLTEALKLEKERVALATQAGGVGIWELDLRRMVILWDAKLDEIFAGAAPHFRTGVPADTYGGTFEEYLETIHPDDVAVVLGEAQRAREGANSIECEFRIRAGAGQWKHIRAFAQVVRDDGGVPLRLVGTNMDITGDRQAAEEMRLSKEAAEAAERTKGEFLAVMSHEIRTPMNTVLGMTRLALQTELTPRQRNYLNKINVSARGLVGILNDVLDFSKIEAGKMVLESTVFTLESVLETVAAVTAMKAEEKGLEIAFAVEPGVPTTLEGDPLRIGQVLINLVNNAIKFTERGEVVVTITGERPVEDSRVLLRVTVRDSGIGLQPDQIPGLFHAFSQTESHISRKYGGTGLGLAISRQLVELMGGRIWAEGRPGVGSTFTFTFEAGIPSEIQARRTGDRLRGLSGRRVLIVDDNASAREILGLMVRRFGMEVTALGSGPLGLAALRQHFVSRTPYDLVLMDWRMPEMDGLEVARLIKSDPQLHGTPAVLMVTAYGREEILERAKQLRLEGVLIKPVTESVMFNTIADALGAAHAGTPAGHEVRSEQPSGSPLTPAHRAALSGRRVLVVDDNALNREVAAEWLEAAGMHVDSAVNGRDALTRLAGRRYDVVLMDVHMPEMDGLTAAREIRTHAHLARLPIVALTAQAQTTDRDASLAAGMNAHLTKPIDEGRLYDTLLGLLTPDAAGAHAAGEPRAGVDDEMEELPAFLPGIDLSAALTLLGGRRPLLVRLLRSFVRDFADAPAALAADHRAGHRDTVGRLAHTVKSAAAYIGAGELADAAAQLEEAARHASEAVVEERVTVFSHYLEAVLAGIHGMFAAAGPAAAARRAPLPAGNNAAALALIAAAEPLVVRGDYTALAKLDEIGRLVSGTALMPLADEVRNHFEELELEAAMRGLQRLRAMLASEARP